MVSVTTVTGEGLVQSENFSVNLLREIETITPRFANNIVSIKFSTTINGESNRVSSFDNFVLIPEPGALAMLGAGGIVLLRRKRPA